MVEIVDITPPIRYSFEQRKAAGVSLSRSRFFLLFGFAPSFTWPDKPPSTFCTSATLGLRVSPIALRTDEPQKCRSGDARLLIEFTRRRSPAALGVAASKVASALTGLFTHVHHTAYCEFAPYQIPREMIGDAQIDTKVLEELEVLTGESPFPQYFRERMLSCVMISEQSTAAILYLLPFVLQDEDLFDACSFFRSGCSEFSLMDGVVREVLDEPRRGPANEIERLAIENVVLQAFRVIEAIVGEPGGNTNRFHARLKAWDLDPHERVGFPGRPKKRLEDRILWLQDARDSATAHGKRRRRTPFTLYEAMEAQHLANTVLHRALWWKAQLQGREGDEAEVAFLLEAMFIDDPGWSTDKKLFGGKRAVDLARTPGGLAMIFKSQGRRLRAIAPRIR